MAVKLVTLQVLSCNEFMKRFSRIFFYLRDKKQNIFLYVLFNLLSVVFSLVSLAMLAPFLQLLFGKEQLTNVEPPLSFSAGGLLQYLKFYLSNLIRTHNQIYALGVICLMIIVSIFL